MSQREYKHCVQRAHERYGLELTEEAYAELCLLAQSGRVIQQEQQQKIVQVRSVLLDRTVYVTWDEIRECVTTLLPPEHFEEI